MEINCDTNRENTAACPVYLKTGECFVDKHHLQFPKRDVQTSREKRQRANPEYQVHVCRALHNAIHASGYRPEIPNTTEPEDEAAIQLAAGQLALENYVESRVNQ